MGRLKTAPRIYLVHWPAIDVMKAGYTEHSRWKSFVGRGAVLLGLWEVDDVTHAFALERELLKAVAWHAIGQGFENSREAEPYLGGGGGGYMECYCVQSAAVEDVQSHASGIAGRMPLAMRIEVI